MRRGVVLMGVAVALLAPVAAGAYGSSAGAASCSTGYVSAHLSWGDKCLRVGEFCKAGDAEYHAFGFDCPASGHLSTFAASVAATAVAPTDVTATVSVGATVLLGRQSRTQGCVRAAVPDPRCSPGAYSSGLTKNVLCSSTFRTGTIRNVPQSEKSALERAYGLKPKGYGRTLEIDHIVSLELGGSNSIANLFPEPGSGAANYHVKDKLENRLHTMVCAGQISLRAAQRQIAHNWTALYLRVFGVVPAR